MRFAGRLLLLILLGLLLGTGWLAADIWLTGSRSDPGPADVALVLGAAVADGVPTPVFAERLNHAVELFRAGTVPKLLISGGVGGGDTVSEAEAGRAYAVAAGVPAEAILVETQSHTTWENLRNSKPILDAAGIATVLVVSDPLHMRRALEIARDAGLDARPSPTPTTRYRSLGTQVPFLLREMYFTVHHWVTRE